MGLSPFSPFLLPSYPGLMSSPAMPHLPMLCFHTCLMASLPLSFIPPSLPTVSLDPFLSSFHHSCAHPPLPATYTQLHTHLHYLDTTFLCTLCPSPLPLLASTFLTHSTFFPVPFLFMCPPCLLYLPGSWHCLLATLSCTNLADLHCPAKTVVSSWTTFCLLALSACWYQVATSSVAVSCLSH